jgi:hypothetical protein
MNKDVLKKINIKIIDHALKKCKLTCIHKPWNSFLVKTIQNIVEVNISLPTAV